MTTQVSGLVVRGTVISDDTVSGLVVRGTVISDDTGFWFGGAQHSNQSRHMFLVWWFAAQ